MSTNEENSAEWRAEDQPQQIEDEPQTVTGQPIEEPVFTEIQAQELESVSKGAVAQDETASKSPLVIAVANQKGGVAKTTTVVSLGGALANRGKEVLLIDLDAQANLTLSLGKDPGRVRGSITDVLFHSARLLSVSRETSIPGLDLVPANAGMELAERFLPVRKEYETILQRTINEELRPQIPGEDPRGRQERSSFERNFPIIEYDYVILDCPPYMGAVTLNALVAADLLVIPTQPEFFSAHALRTMMTTIRQVRSQHNADLVYRILITMLDKRNRIHRQIREQIEKTFGEGVFETIIEVDTKLRESSIEGKPIMFYKAQTRSALQYEALAQEIIDYVR
jgi:chromosome partitioning protein